MTTLFTSLAIVAALAVMVWLFVAYDPFRVTVHFVQLLFSVAISAAISWALWIAGAILVISYYPTNMTAWDINVIASMAAGPPLTRWIHHRYLSGAVDSVWPHVQFALAGALAGALIGRLLIAESLAPGESSIGITGSPRVVWTWVIAVAFGHVHALYLAGSSIVRRLEP